MGLEEGRRLKEVHFLLSSLPSLFCFTQEACLQSSYSLEPALSTFLEQAAESQLSALLPNHTQWHHAGSLKVAVVGVFTPVKLVSATNQSFTFFLPQGATIPTALGRSLFKFHHRN